MSPTKAQIQTQSKEGQRSAQNDRDSEQKTEMGLNNIKPSNIKPIEDANPAKPKTQSVMQQRSSSQNTEPAKEKEDKEDKAVKKEATGQLPKSKSKTNSCTDQGLILTNQFKCLESEVTC